MDRTVILSSVLLICFVTASYPQYSEEDISDKLNALKNELEEQKRLRDRVIAKRWEDKRTYNDAREKFNEEYDDLKDKLEQKNHEIEREKETIEAMQKDVEELKSQLENEKIQFLGLSYIQKNSVNEIARELDKRFQVLIPERQKKINQSLKSTEIKKDNPSEILDELIGLYLDEIELTREIVMEEKGFVLADYSPGMGLMLRVGMVASAYKDKETGRTGIIPRTANTSGKLYAFKENGKVETAMIPMDILRTRAIGKGYTKGEQKGFIASSKGYFKAGGIWMWPLAAIALAALLLLIERFLSWSIKNSGSISTIDKVLESARKGDITKAKKICLSKKRSSVLKAIASVLDNRGKTREVAEKELQEVILKEGPALEKRLTTISVLGAAAPLLGLLGTVAGMIQLFESITLYGTSDPKLMAGGISIALITTQTGLAIAVPIMIAHNFMANRVDALINKMETYALKSLNLLWPQG
jgi:biopolymer transport protein ExbB